MGGMQVTVDEKYLKLILGCDTIGIRIVSIYSLG